MREKSIAMWKNLVTQFEVRKDGVKLESVFIKCCFVLRILLTLCFVSYLGYSALNSVAFNISWKLMKILGVRRLCDGGKEESQMSKEIMFCFR